MTQAWYTDKVVITGLLTAIFAFYAALRAIPALAFLPALDPNIVASIIALLAGIGIFGRATDNTKPKLGLKTRR